MTADLKEFGLVWAEAGKITYDCEKQMMDMCPNWDNEDG